ncbi:MAG: UvrD-helicase domain-containing protein [Myxococcota bacterium]
MPVTAISQDFLSAFARIPRRAQKKVEEFATKFRDNPRSSGINYENITGARDGRLKSVRVGLDYRGIVLAPDEGDVYVLMWVDHHDEAYQWALHKTVDVHPTTGALQVYTTAEEALPRIEEARAAGEGAAATDAASAPGGRFADLSDEQLFLAGVPYALIPAVRAVYSDPELEQLLPFLPPEAGEVLTGVAAGMSLDAALEEVLEREPAKVMAEPVDTTDVAAALQRPQSGRRFRVLDAEFDLESALAYPLEQWRVFLHPKQRQLVERSFNGPMRVLGGAGTGKTVVAMHRAVALVQELLEPDDRVLFTTFTVNLANDIEQQLAKIASPEERARIDVIGIDALASRLARQAGEQFQIRFDGQLQDLWKEVVGSHGEDPWDLGFYQAEWRDVVQAQGIREEREYLRAKRVGRGVKLSRGQRRKVWPALGRFREVLEENGWLEPVDVLRLARRHVEEDPSLARYRSVVVDETQDMNGEALRLLRTIAGEEHPNDMFLVGDAHQRIYGRPESLSACGINVRGRRSRHLRVNYRTTDAIRRFAMATVQGETFDDLDAGTDSTRGEVSLRAGVAPTVKVLDDLAGERAYLVTELQRLIGEEHVPGAHICLIARTHDLLDDCYRPALEAAGIPHEKLGQDEPKTDHIRVATMHRIKGLEFPRVFIAGVNEGVLPFASAALDDADPVIRHRYLQRERCLLYVATSRARDHLTLTAHGTPSPFLPAPGPERP